MSRSWAQLSKGAQSSRQTQMQTNHVKVQRALSHVLLFATLWTVARQAPLSIGFPRQKYLSSLSFPPVGVLPDPGIKPASPTPPALQADSLPAELSGKPIM